ncbi:unnamed protein product [Urochloa decumbens]|uniref:F-box domain-containing protein n=1 Tax=Urochloa decumbens TaxID=240449 RepID=A0ABC9BLM1_9POAL
MEILLRLPPSCRRWARLVCRHWRDVIDERTPRTPPPKLLAFFSCTTAASAHVVGDLAYGRGRQVWCGPWGITAPPPAPVRREARREDPLLNPATGEALRVPPLPVSYRGRHGYGSGKAYTFGFVQATGKYKILHLPCRGDSTGGFNVLQAFTLGGATSRSPARAAASAPASSAVRVQDVEERLAAPHFAHGGEYVLTVQSEVRARKHVYAHRMRDAGRRLSCGEVRSVRIGEPGMEVAYCKDGYYLQTFAYVETTEPSSVYKVDGRVRVGSIRK